MPATQRKSQPQYVPLSVAAEHVQVATKTLRRRIADGQLTGYRFGSRLLRVDLAEVEALLRPIPTRTPTGRAG